MAEKWVLVGGAGFIGRALTEVLTAAGEDVSVIDCCPPRAPVRWIRADLAVDAVEVPDGHVVLLAGAATPRPRRLWTLPHLNAITTARLLPQLVDRDVTLLSSGEVYGWTPGPLREDSPLSLPGLGALAAWCDRAAALAAAPCPPWVSAALCEELVDVDPSGRWVYALSKLAQESLVRRVAGPLRILRLGNVFGAGQERIVTTILRRLAGGRTVELENGVVRSLVSVQEVARIIVARLPPDLYNAGRPVRLTDLAELLMEESGMRCPIVETPRALVVHCGDLDASRLRALLPEAQTVENDLRVFAQEFDRLRPPAFDPPLPVVVPPRPENPYRLVARTVDALQSGQVKHGNRWTTELEARLSELLALPPRLRLVVTTSGTAALRLAAATLVEPHPGGPPLAAVPAFAFSATAEFLIQLGYRLVFVDVDEDTWTMSPASLRRVLESFDVQLVVSVDALGNPADYDQLTLLCGSADVPLIADSAPSLTAVHQGVPVGSQALAHAFSLSFAKVVSAGGAGGFLVAPADTDLEPRGNWPRSSLMTEPSALIALDQLDHLTQLVRHRQDVAAVYERGVACLSDVVPQTVRAGNFHSHVHWAARMRCAGGPGAIAQRLLADGIATKPYYHPALHDVHAGSLGPGGLPVTEALVREVLALPVSSEMTADDADKVLTALRSAMR